MITRPKMVPRRPFGILDLGSSKLACLIAQKSTTGEVEAAGPVNACLRRRQAGRDYRYEQVQHRGRQDRERG